MQQTLERNKEETTYKLINGECLEEMDKMISQGLKVDIILCDPPYGTIKGKTDPHTKERLDAEWDVAIDPVDIFKRAYKLLKPAGSLILFSQEPYTSRLRDEKHPNIKFNHNLIWEKNQFGSPLSARKAPLNYYEDINVFVCISDDDYSQQTFNLNGRSHVSNIFKYAKENKNYSVHPTQKPVELLVDLIETYSNPGETVLDFTMGSGSTGVAAIKTGRKFIGIELEDRYFEIAEDRVTEAIEGL